MLNLAATTDKLQLTTSTAAVIHVHASFVDYVQSPETLTPGKQNTAISSAATTDIVAAPAASTFRNIKYLSAKNTDVTSNEVTLIFDQNGTDFELKKEILLAGDELIYCEGVWQHFLADGKLATSGASVADPRILTKRVSSLHSNATTTATVIPEFTVPLAVGTWVFDALLMVRSDTVTTGIGIAVNFTGTAAVRKMWSLINDAGGLSTGLGNADDVGANPGNMFSGCTVTAFATTAANLVTAGVATINVDILLLVQGILVVTATGNFEMYHGSEAATTTRVEIGSSLVLTQTA